MNFNFVLKVIREAIVAKDLEVMGNQYLGKNNCQVITQITLFWSLCLQTLG